MPQEWSGGKKDEMLNTQMKPAGIFIIKRDTQITMEGSDLDIFESVGVKGQEKERKKNKF